MRRAFCVAIAAFLLVAGVPGGAPAAPAPAHDPHHVLVKFRQPVSTSRRAAVHRQMRARLTNRLGGIGVDVVGVPDGASAEALVDAYRRHSMVEFAELNQLRSIEVAPNDTYFPGNSGARTDLWGLNNVGQSSGLVDADIDAPEGWALTGAAAGTPWPVAGYSVAVIDTGVGAAHEDLAGHVIQPCSRATSGTGGITVGTGACEDDHGHGTHVSGTIAATANNAVGVAGVAFNARIYMCKALSSGGYGYDADIAGCVNDIVAKRSTHDIRALSMSIGGGSSTTLRAAMDQATNAGILVIAAAGNSGRFSYSYPAAYDVVVSVGAITRGDAKASFSTYNPDVEISAPGASIISTYSRYGSSGYAVMSGTSMATPHVAGVAGLISWKTGKTGGALRSALVAAVDDLGAAGRDSSFGYGRVNLCKALGGACAYAPGGAVAGTPVPTATPAPSSTPLPTASPAPTVSPDGLGTLRGTGFVRAAPAPGIVVTVRGRYASGSVTTAADGSYVYRGRPDTVYVMATNGYTYCRANSANGSVRATVTLRSGETATVNWFC